MGEQPSGWRLLAGFLLAPVAPSFLGSAITPAYDGLQDHWTRILMTFPWALIFCGYIPSLFVGLPTYALLRWKLRLTMLNSILAGIFVAILPWALLAFLPTAQEASIGGHATVVDGHLTWFGVLESLKMIGFLAPFGALGGAAFHLVVAGLPIKRQATA